MWLYLGREAQSWRGTGRLTGHFGDVLRQVTALCAWQAASWGCTDIQYEAQISLLVVVVAQRGRLALGLRNKRTCVCVCVCVWLCVEEAKLVTIIS